MTWRDRITLRELDTPLGRIVSGQLLWQGASVREIRGAQASSGDVLMPGGDGGFGVEESGGPRVDPRTVPDDDALRCLRTMGDGIRHRVGVPFLEWLDESPLMPTVDDTLEETELEQVARAALGRLEVVCRRPRTHLKYEEERQPVARCKRPAPRAAMVLASRSEDWERRTLWGVRPRRVLAMVREDLYDLYENRLTVALVDRVDEALLQRLRDVRRVVQQARSVRDWQSVVESGDNHYRASRICRLWGELWSDEGLLARAERALQRLLQLRRRMLALKDSELYRRIGGRSGAIELRMTNVLTHDDCYRAVAELWKAWARHARLGEVTPQKRWDQVQRSFKGMELFGVLLLARALDVLGFLPADEAIGHALAPDARQIELQGPLGGLQLSWEKDESVTLRPAQSRELRVMVLPAMLAGAPSMMEWLDQQREPRLIILFLESDQPTIPLQGRLRLQGPGRDVQGPLFVSVAPWQLESVERLARALRWHIWGDAMRDYPRAVPFPRPTWTPPEALPAYVAAPFGEAQLDIVAPVDGLGWPELEERIRQLEHERERIDSQLAAIAPRDPRRKRDKAHLKKKLADIDRDLDDDRVTLQQVLDHARALAEHLTCPVCHYRGDLSAFDYTDSMYRISCYQCQSFWGLRTCAECQEQFPFLDSPANRPGADPLAADAAYGCDVMALPLAAGISLCPACGEASGPTPR